MSQQLPELLALDFDGVICDGLVEYFASTKRAYEQIWSESIDERLAPSFYRLRPVIETGWEMPILLRALVLGFDEAEILDDFSAIALQITMSEGLRGQEVVRTLDGVRDNWIEHNLDDWLGLHRFYPGVIERIKQILDSTVELYIITTKEGRFVKQLLQRQGIDLDEAQIIGKENKRPKYETLRILRDRHQTPNKDLTIFFVEDRLKALQQVAGQSDLKNVGLFLAAWGYNLEGDRYLAAHDEQIRLLTLEQFQHSFQLWF